MPPLFPGRNPYLEQDNVWEDFNHNSFALAQAALSSQWSEADPPVYVDLQQLVRHA